LTCAKMKNFLKSLSSDEAAQVLQTLLDDNPELIKKAYDIAVKAAGNVDAEDIMHDVYSELDALDVDDLNGRAGRTRYGYVEPHDAAYEIFEEAITPFINEMTKNHKRGLPEAAKQHCIGIIKGLWLYDEESISDLKDWIPDAAGDYVFSVIEEWKKGNPSNEDIAEVMSIVDAGPS